MPRALLAAALAALLLLLLPGALAGAAVDLRWAKVRPTECAAGCRAGACGFEGCAAPASCRGGGCVFASCTAPSCDGGGCKFVDSSAPTCHGGGCDFVRSKTILLDGFCDGGGCTIEGFAARHKTAGSASY